MALRDKALRYDLNKAPFMGHALEDLLQEKLGGQWEFSGSFSFTTEEQYKELSFIDNWAAEDMKDIDPMTGNPKNEYSYDQVKSILEGAGITWSAIQAEHVENIEEYNDNAGKRKRVLEYPDMRNQLDMIYHAIDDGLFGEAAKTSEFYTKIKEVKDRNP